MVLPELDFYHKLVKNLKIPKAENSIILHTGQKRLGGSGVGKPKLLYY